METFDLIPAIDWLIVVVSCNEISHRSLQAAILLFLFLTFEKEKKLMARVVGIDPVIIIKYIQTCGCETGVR